MIVREIKDHRDEVLANFDWFNDYADTRIFAVRCCDEETVRLLDEGWDAWLKKSREQPKGEAEKVLPCPFCGGTDIRFTCHPREGRGPYHMGQDVWSMCCYECGATFPNRYRKELLVECWNRREK